MVSSDGVEPKKGDMRDSLQHFHSWMEENGVQLRGCSLKACEGKPEAGLGVYTTDSHPANDILMVTPLVLAITPMTALQDSLLGPVFATLFEDGDVDDRLVVMLYLLVENLRGDSSFWAPYPEIGAVWTLLLANISYFQYLKILPRKFGMTLCFTEEELLELKGTSLYRATKIQQTSLKREFSEKVKGLANTILTSVGWVEREVEFDDYLWANCIFWTRALNVPFPQSFVIPKILPNPCLVDGIAGVQGLILEGENPELLEKQIQGSSEDSLCRDDKLEERSLQVKLSAEDAVKRRSMDNDSHTESFNQNLPDLGTTGDLERETTAWVEGLVPGIDFCNHATEAVALWEVDDQRGSASGVQYSMYLVTGPGTGLSSNTEILINYGNKGNEELLFLYGFVVDKNPDDYLMVHFPKEALEHGACPGEKSLLLEEQKLPLRWLLPLSLLKDGYVNQQITKVSPNSDSTREKQCSYNYSWSGHRKPPHDLERQVFPEELMAALRIIAMTEEEVQNTTALLQELSEPGSGRFPSPDDIRAAVWEVCGNAGALQLLQDLLTSKMLAIEEGTGSEEIDDHLLKQDAKAQKEALRKGQLGSGYAEDEEFIQKNLMSRNKRACVVYRKGQKNLVRRFLQEVEYALQSWIS